jgi:hypothetical protein
MHKFKWFKGKGMSSRTSLFTEMHLGHNTMLVCLLKLVIASNQSLWATLDIWLIPYYHSSLCLEDGGMSQIFLKSYSFEVDACTSWHRIDFLKNPTSMCRKCAYFKKIYLVLGLCDPIDPFVTIVLHVCLMASHKWWYFTQVHNIPKSINAEKVFFGTTDPRAELPIRALCPKVWKFSILPTPPRYYRYRVSGGIFVRAV